ncbi:MAG: glycosyltransferase family 2 protein [Christensenellales bacterium]|jgi:glycosyltransferase involved in cell wall biosynthesis
MSDITAIILTKNEERNLRDCLASIAGFCKRAVVVDCGSTDRTVEIARAMGADVLVHEFEYYAKQFNWAIDHAGIDTAWTLRIDADERMTEDVIRESRALMATGAVSGIVMEATYYFLGRAIEHGISKKRKLMLFRTGVGRIEDRRRDAHTVLASGQSARIRARFVHRDFKDIASYIARYNWYATREMLDYIAYVEGGGADVNTEASIRATRRRKFGLYYRAPRFLRAKLWFFYNYVLRLGFLDGREGYLYHYLECDWYRTLVDAKIYEYEKTGALPANLSALD